MTDATAFDPNHIDPRVAVALVLGGLVWLAGLYVRDALRQRDDEQADKAREHLETRRAARAAHEHPCSHQACIRPGVVPVHGWWLCREDAAEKGVSA